MRHAVETLDALGVPFEIRVVVAPIARPTCCSSTRRSAADRGLEVIIAGAGGAAHLPGMTAAKTHLPGARRAGRVAARSRAWTRCSRSCRCRPGVPVGTLAIGRAGAVNAALLAAAILALHDDGVRERLVRFRDDADRAPCSTHPTRPSEPRR